MRFIGISITPVLRIAKRVNFTGFRLDENPLDNFARYVSEAEVAALAAEGEPFVVDAHEVEDGGMEVVDVDLVLDGCETEFIRGAVGGAAFDSAASEPH